MQLEAEKRVLANAEKLYTAAMSAHELLYEAEDSAETTLGGGAEACGGAGAVRCAVCGAGAAAGGGEGERSRMWRRGAGLCGEGDGVAGAAGGD